MYRGYHRNSTTFHLSYILFRKVFCLARLAQERINLKSALKENISNAFIHVLGLFTADQKLRGDFPIYTRQNPAETGRGLEVPEERDYYPYWGPTPWKDIAIMVSD